MMDSTQVRFRFEAVAGANKDLQINVKTIRWPNEEITYIFPTELQDAHCHEQLLGIPNVKRACNSLLKAGQFRNISVTLPSTLSPLYLDENRNFIFHGIYLEEAVNDNQLLTSEIPVPQTTNYADLVRIIEMLTLKLETKQPQNINLSQITQQFVLQKFQNRENASYWMEMFEKECSRTNVISDIDKIQVLRLFLGQNALEWYSSTLYKLTLQGKWDDWRSSFKQTFSDKSWRKVHFAYTYKFIGGSLLDFALKKERLLLETESTMSDRSRINHIVIGLPNYIQDRLDKEEITTTEQLMNQLSKFSDSYPTPKKNYKTSTHPTISKSPSTENQIHTVVEKRPCSICEALGYPGRFHPTDSCRNKTRTRHTNSVYLTESDEMTVNTQEESKNGDIHH